MGRKGLFPIDPCNVVAGNFNRRINGQFVNGAGLLGETRDISLYSLWR